VLSKEEVEKLLRHGAYEIFREEKSGTSERESSEFLEQDIDTILKRRAKTLVHDNTGSRNRIGGSTFSKASFKCVKGIPLKGFGCDNSEDVDVDDPDFWTKTVGEANPENDFSLLRDKRMRNAANYTDEDFPGFVDAQSTTFSDDDSSFASDKSYNCSDDGEVDFDLSQQAMLTNKFLEDIRRHEIRKRELRERSKWGGRLRFHWEKNDVVSIIRHLERFGYGNLAWEDFVKVVRPDLSKEYEINEVGVYFHRLLFISMRLSSSHLLQSYVH